MDTDKNEPPAREDMPRNFTRLSQHRTLMATERTYSAWIRTVLSLVAVALALPKLITTVTWEPVVRFVAVVFILIAGIIFAFSTITYSRTIKKLKEERLVTTPPWVSAAINLALLVCLLLLLFLVLHKY